MDLKKIRRASALAILGFLLAATAVFADTIPADGDAIAGNQGNVDLGTKMPGELITRQVNFSLVCSGSSHAIAGQTATIQPSSYSKPLDGTIVSTSTTIGPVPSTWPVAPGGLRPDAAGPARQRPGHRDPSHADNARDRLPVHDHLCATRRLWPVRQHGDHLHRRRRPEHAADAEPPGADHRRGDEPGRRGRQLLASASDTQTTRIRCPSCVRHPAAPSRWGTARWAARRPTLGPGDHRHVQRRRNDTVAPHQASRPDHGRGDERCRRGRLLHRHGDRRRRPGARRRLQPTVGRDVPARRRASTARPWTRHSTSRAGRSTCSSLTRPRRDWSCRAR